MVCTFSGRRTAAGAFTASSGVFLYDPAIDSWSDVSHADMHYWTKDIIIDPTDPAQNTWYVAVFSGWGGAPNGKGGLFRTTNRGATWTKLTGTQFDRVTSITFNPILTSQAYLTTEVQGLWISSNMNAPTPSWSLVSNYDFRQPERVFFNPFNANEVWVSSFGNGLKVGLSGALPVKLITFNGNRDNSISRLQWVTSNEVTGDRFEIERSINGLSYLPIGSIKGKGSLHNEYKFADTIPAQRIFYRLKMYSATGNHFYSPVIVFNNNNALKNYVRLLENPVKDKAILQVKIDAADKLDIRLMDLSGNILSKHVALVQKGINQFSIPLQVKVAAGNYVLQVNGKEIKATLRIIKPQ